MTEEIKIGIIGAGYRHSLAVKAHQPNKNCWVKALVDPLKEATTTFCEALPDTQVFESVDTMLEQADINTVFVMSPDWLHEEHVIKSLEAGMDVFLEKPMAITTESADKIIKCAERTNQKLFVGHNMRFMKFVKQIEAVIESGVIGEIKTIWVRHFIGNGEENYFNSWHSEQKYCNSLVVHKGSHDIDIIQILAGSRAVKVNALGSKLVFQQGDVEDVTIMNMELENGVLASYQQCHFSPDTWRNYTVIGTKGRLENIGDRSEKGAVIKVWTEQQTFSENGDLEFIVEPENRECDQLMLDRFFAFVRGKVDEQLPLTARDAVATATAATESMRSGGSVINIEKYN